MAGNPKVTPVAPPPPAAEVQTQGGICGESHHTPRLIDLHELPRIPLRSFVTVEGVQGVSGQNTRTITRGGAGMQGLEIDLLPTIAHIWVRLPPIPGQPNTQLRERLVPCANVSAEQPLR
jgi:hypothetical protein